MPPCSRPWASILAMSSMASATAAARSAARSISLTPPSGQDPMRPIVGHHYGKQAKRRPDTSPTDADGVVEVLLVHPGGPFWANKDAHAWSIPKGEYVEGEDAETVALREFQEELGSPPPEGSRLFLGEFGPPSRKRISAWALEADFDATHHRQQHLRTRMASRLGPVARVPRGGQGGVVDHR